MKKGRILQMLEVVLLSVGVISSVGVMKETVLPYSCHALMSGLTCIKCFLYRSSPPTVVVAVVLMVAFILASSAFFAPHHHRDHHELLTTLLDLDLDIDLDEPPPAPPPPPRDVFEVPPSKTRNKHTLNQPHDHHESLLLPAPSPRTRNNHALINQPHDHHESLLLPPPSPRTRNNHHSHDHVYVDHHESLVLPPPSPRTRNNHQPYDHVHIDHHESLLLSPPSPITRNNHALINQPHDHHESLLYSEDIWKDVFVLNATEIEEDDTMEATWKAITGGGEQKPKKKHLTKSETWDVPPPPPQRSVGEEEVVPKWKELRKAETFNDAVSVIRRGGMIRREPSMSLEEFNHKVEAFIKNFNNDMRLQRQESHQRFLLEKKMGILCHLRSKWAPHHVGPPHV